GPADTSQDRRTGPVPRAAVCARPLLPAAAQVAFELAGDRVTAGLRKRRLRLPGLQRADVLGDLGIARGKLVDLAFPRLGPLGEVSQRDLDVEQVLDAA